MNDAFIVLYCVLLYTQSALHRVGGSVFSIHLDELMSGFADVVCASAV